MNTSNEIIVPFKISRENYQKINMIKIFCIAAEENFEELFNSCLSDFLDCMLKSFEFDD